MTRRWEAPGPEEERRTRYSNLKVVSRLKEGTGPNERTLAQVMKSPSGYIGQIPKDKYTWQHAFHPHVETLEDAQKLTEAVLPIWPRIQAQAQKDFDEAMDQEALRYIDEAAAQEKE